MRLPNPIPLTQIAKMINAEIIGNPDALVTGINEIHKVVEGDLMFVDIARYFKKAFQSVATFIIINERIEPPEGKHLLLCDNPFEAYNYLARQFSPRLPLNVHISDSANIHPTARLEPGVVVGHEVTIAEGTWIRANSVIHDHTVIGKEVLIHANSVIGADAFYYKKTNEHWEKWHTCGRVVIEDNVEIGAGCTIDKGVSGDTIIGAGSKLDNQVHVGHGVIVGRGCLIAAQVGIAGKTILEDGVKLWGQVGVAARLRIGAEAQVYAQSGVSRDLAGGQAYFGCPAIPLKEWFSDYRAAKRLPREVEKLKDSTSSSR